MEPSGADARPEPDGPPPGVPSGGMLLLAFVGIVVAGVLGALAGWGIVDTGSHGSDGSAAWLAAAFGGLIGAIGGGVVAVLVLRARSLWRIATEEPDDPDDPAARP